MQSPGLPRRHGTVAGHGRHTAGFTLIELLVVFAIVALLTALVPIAYDRLRESSQYRDTLRTLLSDLRSARQRALAERTEVRFEMNLAERTYGIDGGPSHLLPEPLALHTTVADQELTQGRVAAIRFLPEGGATGGSIDLVRPSGAGTRLQVDWLSGRIEQQALAP